MAVKIDDEMIDYVGILAKLSLSPEEKEAAKSDMSRMLEYIDMLNQLDTSEVEPMSHVFDIHNVFREDVVENGDESDAMLSNAPEQKEKQYKVPRTVEQKEVEIQAAIWRKSGWEFRINSAGAGKRN